MSRADADHDRRGFSSFRITTLKSSYDIGRLPAPYFRLVDPSGVEDPELLKALAELDCSRKLLVVADESWSTTCGSRVATFVRSVAPYNTFIRRLFRLIPANKRAHAATNPST
jgi:hypothetical protein